MVQEEGIRRREEDRQRENIQKITCTEGRVKTSAVLMPSLKHCLALMGTSPGWQFPLFGHSGAGLAKSGALPLSHQGKAQPAPSPTPIMSWNAKASNLWHRVYHQITLCTLLIIKNILKTLKKIYLLCRKKHELCIMETTAK